MGVELNLAQKQAVIDAVRNWPKNLTSQLLLERLDILAKTILTAVSVG